MSDARTAPADGWLTLGPVELAGLFGGTPEQVAEWCASELTRFDLACRVLEGEDRDARILEALKRLDRAAVSAAGVGRQQDWEAGWSENLREFLQSNDFDALVPKYIRPGEPIRLLGGYARPRDPWFVRNYTKTFRAWLTRRFLTGATALYEFGCGSCSHVAYLAGSNPGTPVFGFDWTAASGRIIEALAVRTGWPVAGGRFDFFAPDPTVSLRPGAAVLTFGALEQVGGDFQPFLDFLLAAGPARCVHVEGLEELYDDSRLLDGLALRYHRQRNYLSGFLTRLRALEAEGRIVLEQVHRHHFGTRFDDTFSYVVWRPV